jgi:hypothetical protein
MTTDKSFSAVTAFVSAATFGARLSKWREYQRCCDYSHYDALHTNSLEIESKLDL